MEDFNNIQTAEIINLGLFGDIGEQYYLKRYMKLNIVYLRKLSNGVTI